MFFKENNKIKDGTPHIIRDGAPRAAFFLGFDVMGPTEGGGGEEWPIRGAARDFDEQQVPSSKVGVLRVTCGCCLDGIGCVFER